MSNCYKQVTRVCTLSWSKICIPLGNWLFGVEISDLGHGPELPEVSASHSMDLPGHALLG